MNQVTHKHILVLLIAISTAVRAQTKRNNDGFPSMLHQMGGGGGMCRISSRELMITAEATASRILHGVCNPRELDERLILLEMRVGDQFNVLKAMVLDLETKLRDQDQQVKRQHRGLHRAILSVNKKRRRLPTPESNTEHDEGEEIDSNATEPGYADFLTDGLNELQETKKSPREMEVTKYNSSIHIADGHRVFTYFWRVEDTRYRMNNWGWRRSLRSPEFYIFKFGYKMFMRIYPNNDGENIYIHVALTKGDYDASLEWPFVLPIRVSVVDHSRNPDDIQGRIWYPSELCSGLHWQQPTNGDNQVCVGLGFSQNDLEVANYVFNDALTIKFTVVLD